MVGDVGVGFVKFIVFVVISWVVVEWVGKRGFVLLIGV